MIARIESPTGGLTVKVPTYGVAGAPLYVYDVVDSGKVATVDTCRVVSTVGSWIEYCSVDVTNGFGEKSLFDEPCTVVRE
jgi:hypothetical protein